jgi:hypothetical protein
MRVAAFCKGCRCETVSLFLTFVMATQSIVCQDRLGTNARELITGGLLLQELRLTVALSLFTGVYTFLAEWYVLVDRRWSVPFDAGAKDCSCF